MTYIYSGYEGRGLCGCVRIGRHTPAVCDDLYLFLCSKPTKFNDENAQS